MTDKNIEITRDEMVRIRGNVRHRLICALHERMLQERLYRKAGELERAQAEHHEVSLLKAMIHEIDAPDFVAGDGKTTLTHIRESSVISR